MKDARERLRDLDRLQTPDVWGRATSIEPRRDTDEILGGPAAPKRIVAGVVAFAVFLAAGAFAWRALRSEPTTQAASSTSSVDGTILWPERTGDELAATQATADSGDADVAWRLNPKDVATHFVEEVLGWGSPEGRYSLEVVEEGSSPPAVLVTIVQVPIPCPSPMPGNPSSCPPPYEGESISLEQAGVTGPNGIWTVTSVRADGLELDLEPGDTIEAGGSVSGHVSFPDSAVAIADFSAAAGSVVRSEGTCSGVSGASVEAGEVSIQTPTFVTSQDSSCGSGFTGYAWIATAPRQLDTAAGPVDPLSPGGNDISPRLYGLTIVPMLVSTPDSQSPAVSPSPTPPGSAGEATRGADR